MEELQLFRWQKTRRMAAMLDARQSQGHPVCLSTNTNFAERPSDSIIVRQDGRTKLSVSQPESIRKGLEIASPILLDSVYNIFGFEPLHDFHLSISKQLEGFTLKHFGLDVVMTNPESDVEQ